MNTYYLPVSVGYELGNNSSGGFIQHVSRGCSHFKAGVWLEVLLPTWLVHMTVGTESQFLCDSWQETFVPCLVGVLRDCLSVLMTWELPFPSVSKPRAVGKEKAVVPCII